MPNLANYAQSGLLSQLFFNKVFEVVPNIYMGLTSGVPTNLFNGNELSGFNYTRVLIGTGYGPWSALWPSGMVFNNNQINFNVANGGWGMVSGALLYDGALFSSNTIAYTALATPKDIQLNDQFYSPTSGLSFRVW